MNNSLIVITAITTNAMAGVLMKMLTTETAISFEKEVLFRVVLNPYFWAAVVCYVLALILFTIALSRLDLSLAYPTIVSGAMIMVSILSILLFGESFNVSKAVGILLILAGVCLLYRA